MAITWIVEQTDSEVRVVLHDTPDPPGVIRHDGREHQRFTINRICDGRPESKIIYYPDRLDFAKVTAIADALTWESACRGVLGYTVLDWHGNDVELKRT